jgi:hypothetical protein
MANFSLNHSKYIKVDLVLRIYGLEISRNLVDWMTTGIESIGIVLRVAYLMLQRNNRLHLHGTVIIQEISQNLYRHFDLAYRINWTPR